MRVRERHLSRLAACLVSFATILLPAQDNEITWLGNYREALQQAKQENKPIFLEFRCEA
jgi:uncharacterized protein YyaL (SSP411 family)